MTQVASQIKATFSREVIHTQENEWQSGVRLCVMVRLPTHLVQELNAGTVSSFIYTVPEGLTIF